VDLEVQQGNTIRKCRKRDTDSTLRDTWTETCVKTDQKQQVRGNVIRGCRKLKSYG